MAVFATCLARCCGLLARYRVLPITFPVAFPQFSFCRAQCLAVLLPCWELAFSRHPLLLKNPFLCCGSHNTGFQPKVEKLFVPEDELALGCAEASGGRSPSGPNPTLSPAAQRQLKRLLRPPAPRSSLGGCSFINAPPMQRWCLMPKQ